MADKFESYFKKKTYDLEIKLLHEKQKLGTAGSLLLTDDDEKDLLVCNADLVTDFEYINPVLTSINNDFDLVISVREYSHQIPFGVIQSDKNSVRSIQEKPNVNFDVAAGIYFLRRKTLELISKNTFFDMPDLISSCLKNNLKVGICNVTGTWIDVGMQQQYDEAILQND